MHKVVIIGAGQVGQTLGRLLNRSGKYRVAGVYDIKMNQARAGAVFIGRGAAIYQDAAEAVRAADIIFITTPDDVIEHACRKIFTATSSCHDKIVAHCSGSQPSGILKSAKRHRGVYIASLHPMQTFADKAETARNFRGTYCVYEGDARAVPSVRRIINAIGGIPVRIQARNKILYHAGCVFASNYLVVLLEAAQSFLKQSGFSDKNILKSVKPLIEATIKNVSRMGIPDALTGPFSRGDELTVRNHIKAIRQRRPAYKDLYRALGRHAMVMALKKGTISAFQAGLLRKAMDR
jgi:predicted short-subunit dehydrogenase-like oxidoreductase (DUF2520 family)